MLKRLKRVVRWSALLPLLLFFEAVGKAFDHLDFVGSLVRKLAEYGVLDFLGSPRVLIVMSILWLSALIIGPDLWKRLPQHAFRGQPRLRTWIDESERHDLLNARLRRCKSEEAVRFISFTGKSVLLPEELSGRSLADSPFPRAVRRGVTFQGLLLDPQSDEAKFRSEIETPGTPEPKRLLYKHAAEVAELRVRYELAGIKQQITLANVNLKYISLGLQFSLWLFDDVALIEPYHLGRRERIGNLCEFAQMIIPRSDINYNLLEDHFQNLWNHAPARPVWPI